MFSWFIYRDFYVNLHQHTTMDHLSLQQRHKNMASIKSKNTKPEMIVRKGLWRKGFRYRLNDKRLPGHPDLVLRKYRTCIFINGCFWHGHHIHLPFNDLPFNDLPFNDLPFNDLPFDDLPFDDLPFTIESSDCCKIPKTNREFWINKIRRNKMRDKDEQRRLAEMGWHSIVVWECELKPKVREKTLESLAFTLNHIWLKDRQVYPELEENYLLAAEQSQQI